MYKKYKSFIIIKLITCSFISYASYIESDSEEEQNKRKNFSHISASPRKYNSQITSPEGYFKINEDKLTDVRVQFYLSLGDPLIGKISKQVKKADQFSFAFMYRFSSPILLESFRHKAENSVLFIDRNQCYEDKDKQNYNSFIQELVRKVPTSLVDLKSKSFHQKIIICKTKNQQAFTIVGSANATFEAENKHSEDVFFIQSNYLAKIFMKTFYHLFNVVRNTEQNQPERLIDIYHERLIEGFESNTDYLLHSLKILKKDKSKLNDTFGLKASVNALAISTGFSTGKMNCFDLFKQQVVPDKGNKILILFQNYLTHDSELFELIKNNGAKKLVILDDNQNNDDSFDQLSKFNKDKVLPIKFKNFTGGKFHHKASLQYKIDETRTVYTGSFNLSKNAVQNNSEYILGIENQELPGIFLSTLLKHNSSLNNNPMVWKFISQNPELFDDNIKEQAKRTILDIDQNIRNYKKNFFTSIEELESEIDNKFDNKIIRLFKSNIDNEKISFEEESQLYGDLIDFILTNDLPMYFIRDGHYKGDSQSIKKFVKQKIDNIMQKVEASEERMDKIIKERESGSSKEKLDSEDMEMEIDIEENNPNKTEDIDSSTLRKEINNIKKNIAKFKEEEKDKNIEDLIRSFNKIKTKIDQADSSKLILLKNELNRQLVEIFKNYKEYSIDQKLILEEFNIQYDKKSSREERLKYLYGINVEIDKNINLLNKKLTYDDLKDEINILKTNLEDLNKLTNILDKIQEISSILLDLAKLKSVINGI